MLEFAELVLFLFDRLVTVLCSSERKTVSCSLRRIPLSSDNFKRVIKYQTFQTSFKVTVSDFGD